jgi:hypothetical protein
MSYFPRKTQNDYKESLGIKRIDAASTKEDGGTFYLYRMKLADINYDHEIDLDGIPFGGVDKPKDFFITLPQDQGQIASTALSGDLISTQINNLTFAEKKNLGYFPSETINKQVLNGQHINFKFIRSGTNVRNIGLVVPNGGATNIYFPDGMPISSINDDYSSDVNVNVFLFSDLYENVKLGLSTPDTTESLNNLEVRVI